MNNKLDILHCQEINIDENSFSQCNFISANYNIFSNNALNKYGTASFVKNDFVVENLKMDTEGRAIIFSIDKLTLGNIYLQSGTDAISRGKRETYCSEIIPQLLLNCQESGCLGGDWNNITDKNDCTRNPDSKMSPSLKRLIQVFSLKDTFRSLYPDKSVFSRYYSSNRFGDGASRIDRNYHWGCLKPVEASYESIAFSDHLVHVVTAELPQDMEKITSPKVRPFFKTSPEVVLDKVFQDRVKVAMSSWKEIKDKGLEILPWWEIIVKPGIRRIAISRSKEINRQRRGRLNALLLQQSFLTKEIQTGDFHLLAGLKDVQTKIQEWYDSDSQRVVLQSRVDDVQQSEKVRIYHHDQHRKLVKRSSILKLKTETQTLVGHDACSNYLMGEAANLLLHPAVLDVDAQAKLLAEVEPVFSTEDNNDLEKDPSKEDVKDVLFKSNLNAAPGTDGLTSLLYKECWDSLGDALHQVCLAVRQGECLTVSQRTSLMVFGSKPKKLNSILPKDKRRISLLNSDFKLIAGLEAEGFKRTFNHTLSPLQLVAGTDRRIHFGINKARDCINSVSGSKSGYALLDLDFIAAFDYTVFSWVFAVLRAKGVSETVISRVANMYANTITIPVVNNVTGQPLKNVRGSLRQGCPGSMGWFAIAIDPLLILLERQLSGIPICSLPTFGPPAQDGTAAQHIEERYKVYGLADDVKPGVSSLAEFALVDMAAELFEKSSGNKLHRDPLTGKCKVLPLGKWKNTLKQDDIGFPYLRISSQLSMVGVELTASWQTTRKVNNDDLQNRVQGCIGAWKSGKHMPLVARPYSLNTYCLSKLWFRTCSVDLREGDIAAITSKVKSYLYQDLLLKPSEVTLFRQVQDGGLALQHVRCKGLAHLISTFLLTAANKNYQQSLYSSWLFRYHVEGDTSLPDPGFPPYYPPSFFKIIRDVKDNSSLNPIWLTVKQWYTFLLEKFVTMREPYDDGRQELIPNRIEESFPNIQWADSYRLSRLPGLSPASKSFLFKLIHQLLPSRARVNRIIPANNPLCWCENGEAETYLHCFFTCVKNKEAADAMLRCAKVYDNELTEERSLTLQVRADEVFMLATITILTTGLELIWANRLIKKTTSLYMMRAELECAVSIRRRSRNRKIREAGEIIQNIITNFF